MKTPIIIRLGWLLLLVAAVMTACTPEGIPYQEEEPGVFHFSAVVEGKEFKPVYASEKACIVFVPGGTDLTQLVASFSGEFVSVQVDGKEQESGVTANNFSNYKKGVVYKVEGADGTVIEYNVKVLDSKLPVVVVTTDTQGKINSRTVWRNAGIRIQDADGSLALYRGFIGNDAWPGYVDYLNGVVDLIRQSARRDIAFWSNPYFTLDKEAGTVRKGFKSKINWMDTQINAL